MEFSSNILTIVENNQFYQNSLPIPFYGMVGPHKVVFIFPTITEQIGHVNTISLTVKS